MVTIRSCNSWKDRNFPTFFKLKLYKKEAERKGGRRLRSSQKDLTESECEREKETDLGYVGICFGGEVISQNLKIRQDGFLPITVVLFMFRFYSLGF